MNMLRYTLLYMAALLCGTAHASVGATVEGLNVSLRWLPAAPADGLLDTFEGHDDFAINSPGTVGWRYVDADNRATYTWGACTFPGMGQKMAFLVMNNAATTPPLDGYASFQATSGNKFLVDFCALDVQNNDYIISPELSFGAPFTLSFCARSYSASYGKERIRVGYSLAGDSPADFIWLTPSPYQELGTDWQRLDFAVPAAARYVAINCVSDDAFMLMLDDIYICSALPSYNVFRDGKLLTPTPTQSTHFEDTAPDYGTYTYTIEPVGAAAAEPGQWTTTVDVKDTRLLPFFDDFDDWTMHADRWETWDGNEPCDSTSWSIDYHYYGLIDPAAAYRYSSRQNYDQSLVSRELSTDDIASTCLRFNLRLDNYEQHTPDYLTVEVSSDGCATWQELATYDNTKGAQYWQTHTLNLGPYLTSRYFRIRFRAHGANAFYIDYWYVDDVKVWNPAWGSADLSIDGGDGATINLAGTKGGTATATADNTGRAHIDRLEIDDYDIEITRPGRNTYHGKLTIGGLNTPCNIHLTAPSLALDSAAVRVAMPTESQTVHTINLTNTGDGPATFHFANTPAKATGDIGQRWQSYPSWNASGDLQSSIAFDGENFYTTSSTNLGEFWKYDRGGKLIEKFSIPEMYYRLYDLAYDGRYFYGSDNKNRLFVLDFENRRIAGLMTFPDLDVNITHVSYDPDRGGFWLGDWNSIAFVSRSGKVLSRLAAIDANNANLAVYGSAYDNVSADGPCLWLASQEAPDDNMLDKVMIRRYDLTSRKLSTEYHVASDAPGYKAGRADRGQNTICGLCATTDLHDGSLTLVGMLSQSPSLVFSYKIADADPWLTISPRHGTIAPGATMPISLGLNSLHTPLGATASTTARLTALPEADDIVLPIAMTAATPTPTPRPTGLTATAGEGEIELAWSQPDGANEPAPTYNIYRDGELLIPNSSSPAYTDRHLPYGTYTYTVEAVYGDRVSAKSEPATVLLKHGGPYYAPTAITARIDSNRIAHIAWQSPSEGLGGPATLTWSTGRNADQLGMTQGGYFYAATVWGPDELQKHRARRVKSVSVQLVNPATFLALRITKDGEVVYKQTYKGDILYDGTFTEVPLTEPMELEQGAEYYFAFQIMNTADIRPLAMDDSPARDGKGNMLSMDGTNWFPASQMAIEGNFNINVNLEPVPGYAEQEPAGYSVSHTAGGLAEQSDVSGASLDIDLDSPGTHTFRIASRYADGGVSPMSQPVSVEVVDISQRMAPQHIAASVEGNREVSLRWDYPAQTTFPTDITRPTAATANEYVMQWQGRGTEIGVASDGRYLYTSATTMQGRINRYSLAGEYLGTFAVDGVDAIWNLAADGRYLYAADNTTYIHKIDPEAEDLVASIPISEYARHLDYIPEQDAFVVGDWQSSIIVGRDGSKLATGPVLRGAAGSAVVGGKLYAFEQGATDNAHTIAIYDMSTGLRTDSIDIAGYTELGDLASATAGGLSAIRTPEGITYLALSVQRPGNTQLFALLDISGMKAVAGYNVVRDGKVVGIAPCRAYRDTIAAAGTYAYQVQTRYIDGTLSELSAPQTVEIEQAGEADAPQHIAAEQARCGYNALVSFADLSAAQQLDGFRSWPATGSFAFAARNADDRQGQGIVEVLYSANGNAEANFIALTTIATTEQWSRYDVSLPEGAQYVALRKAAAMQTQTVCPLPDDNVWAYDIMRDGVQLNDKPIKDIGYTDRNLPVGNYSYQVRLTTRQGAVSPWSQPIGLAIDYESGSPAPQGLNAMLQDDGSVQLRWQQPALAMPTWLRWHSGRNKAGAGLPSGGAFYAAVKWTATDLRPFDQMTLTDIETYVYQVPQAMYVLVYEGATLVRQQFVPTLRQYSFNTIHLDEPLPLDPTKDLRVAVYVEHNEITAPLGYDDTPAVAGRGNLYSTDGTTWTTLKDEGEIDANWNISIGLSPYAKPKRTAAGQGERDVFLGYNVYRTGERLAEHIDSTSWLDTTDYRGRYLEYQVSADYSLSGEKFSDKVVIMGSGIEDTEALGEGRQDAIYYDLAGRRAALPLAKGAYIARTPKGVCKVIVR